MRTFLIIFLIIISINCIKGQQGNVYNTFIKLYVNDSLTFDIDTNYNGFNISANNAFINMGGYVPEKVGIYFFLPLDTFKIIDLQLLIKLKNSNMIQIPLLGKDMKINNPIFYTTETTYTNGINGMFEGSRGYVVNNNYERLYDTILNVRGQFEINFKLNSSIFNIIQNHKESRVFTSCHHNVTITMPYLQVLFC
ncbi:MAG: hypothetical protein HY951_03210 [Bacteroidia bacterium]|nr:hypothetical protein [Bacteroidia bacterium]